MPHRRFSVLSDSEPEEQNANIIIPDFLRQRVNFLQSPCAGAPDYEVSPMARHYFRKHSNIMTLLDEYMVGRSPMPDIELLPRMIRFAVSLPGKRVFKPLKEFRFESIYHEAIAKILLTYPLIKDEATLHLYLKFQNKHCLKLPFVDMLQNNAVHSDGVKHFFEDDASDDDNDVSSTREDENRSNSTTSMAVSRCSSETSPSLRIPLARLLDENILPKTVISNLKGTPAAQSTPHEQKNSVNLVASTNLRSPRTRNQAQPNVSPKTRVQVQQNPSEAGPSSQSLEKVVQKQPKLLPDFYVDEDETCLSYDCIKVLLADEMFTSQAKHHLKDKFSKHFDIFWHSKSHVILKRFIIDLWSNDMEALANLVGKCQKNTIVKTLEILDKHMKNQEKAAGLSLAQDHSPNISVITINDEDSLIQSLGANHQDQINERKQSDELAAAPGESTMRLNKNPFMSALQLAAVKSKVPSIPSPSASTAVATTGVKRKLPAAMVVASPKKRRKIVDYSNSEDEMTSVIESGNETDAHL